MLIYIYLRVRRQNSLARVVFRSSPLLSLDIILADSAMLSKLKVRYFYKNSLISSVVLSIDRRPKTQASNKIKPLMSFATAYNTHIAIVLVASFLGVVYYYRAPIREFLNERHRRLGHHGFFSIPIEETFEHDLENGLNSDNFSLEGNLKGDTRKGLLVKAKEEIKNIMVRNSLSFDEARLIYTQRELDKNGIDKDGIPRDPKFVSF